MANFLAVMVPPGSWILSRLWLREQLVAGNLTDLGTHLSVTKEFCRELKTHLGYLTTSKGHQDSLDEWNKCTNKHDEYSQCIFALHLGPTCIRPTTNTAGTTTSVVYPTTKEYLIDEVRLKPWNPSTLDSFGKEGIQIFLPGSAVPDYEVHI